MITATSSNTSLSAEFVEAAYLPRSRDRETQGIYPVSEYGRDDARKAVSRECLSADYGGSGKFGFPAGRIPDGNLHPHSREPIPASSQLGTLLGLVLSLEVVNEKGPDIVSQAE